MPHLRLGITSFWRSVVLQEHKVSTQLKSRRFNVTWVLLALVLLIAAYLRFASLNLAEFKGDEAGTSMVLKAFLQQGKIPLTGPPLSTGGNAGPIYYYILAVPFVLSANPIVASAFIASLNVAGVAFTFKFAREFFNTRVALIATALQAVSPFAVLFSRKIWNPDLIFPFTVILFYCLYAFVIKDRPKYLIPVFVLYAIILQIHPITLFLAPVILFFLWRFRSQIRLDYFFIGMALFVVAFAPFIYGEFANGFGEAGNFASTLKDFSLDNVNPSVIALIFADTSGTGFDYILGSGASSFYSSILNINNYFIVENICLFLGSALVMVRAAKNPFGTNVKYSMLLAWISIPTLILLFFNPTDGLYTHHLVMFFPANFLMVAVLFDYGITLRPRIDILGRRRFDLSKVARILAVVVLLSILLVQIIFGIGLLSFLNSQGGTAGDYGVGVQYKMDVAEFIAHDSNGSSFTISSDLSPGQIGPEYSYLLSLYNMTPSSTAALSYVIVDNLMGPDASLLQQLSGYPEVSFGPLSVYVLQQGY